MPRYTPSGKKIVYRKPKAAVPPELLAVIDGQAVKVLKLRDDYGDLKARVTRLDRRAYEAGFEADLAADPGRRKILSDQADRLTRQAGALRADLDQAAQVLREQETVLSGLHGE